MKHAVVIAGLALLLGCEPPTHADATLDQPYDDEADATAGGNHTDGDGGTSGTSTSDGGVGGDADGAVQGDAASASGDGGLANTGSDADPGSEGDSGASTRQWPRCDQVSACAALDGPCSAAWSSECGSVSMGGFSCGDATHSASGFHFSDGTSFACVGSDCAAASQSAAQHCAAVMTSGGGGGGTGGTGSMQPTSVWSKRHETTSNLGAVATQAYHRARFSLDLQADASCSVNVDSPMLPTGYTGTTTIALSSAQQACLKQTANCAKPVKVQWGSCGSASCGELETGPVWETARPGCSVTMPAGAFSLRLTIARLGAGGLDETWEVISP